MAYDFVQQRDTGTKARVSERQVIKTIEDQHKYDMPDQRRLFVAADYVNMPMATPYSPLTKLAEALAEVKPEIMDYAANKTAEKNKELFEQGKVEAYGNVDETIIKNEWQRKGYLTTKGFLNGEDYGSRLMEDWKAANKEIEDPEGGGLKTVGFDEFYQDWWKKNATALTGRSAEFLNTFNKSFGKYVAATRDKHNEYSSKLRLDQDEATATDHAYRIMEQTRTEQFGVSTPFSIYDLEATAQELKTLYPTFTNARIDELLYGAAKKWAEDSGDAEILSVFKENHSDGTPGLHAKKLDDTNRFSSRIDNDINTIASQKWTMQKRAEEVAKTGREKAREEIYRTMFTGNADEATIQEGMQDLYKKGYFTNIEEMNQELNALLNVKKKAETKVQQVNALQLRIAVNEGKRISAKDLTEALIHDEISWEGAKMIQAEIEAKTARDQAENRADAREAKKNAALEKEPMYNKAVERIKAFFPNVNTKNLDPDAWATHEQLIAEMVYEFQTRALDAKNKSELMDIADDVITKHGKTVPKSNINDPKYHK